MNQDTLVVITGPTGSGKTSLAIELANRLGCEIISADSRQIYTDMEVGTAAPTAAQLSAARHHLVGFLSPGQYYSAACYERDVMDLLPEVFARGNGYAILCGGSMMYIDAVLKGIDDMPTISDEVRSRVAAMRLAHTDAEILAWLETLDPDYYQRVDRANMRRVLHAIEVSMQAGVPYSCLCKGEPVQRPFRTVMMAIDYPREQLFDRINRRVDMMVEQGLEQEARRLYPMRGCNALNTVGYKEMFAYFDGLMDRDTAIARIGKNTRVYAKKQLLWLSKQQDVVRLDPQRALVQALEAVGL